MIKRHTRKSQQHPQGAIVEREGTIHISNVMKAEHASNRRRQPHKNFVTAKSVTPEK
jgi:ribosomal protein L24